MPNNYGMYQGYNVEGTAEVKITPDSSSSNDMNNVSYGNGSFMGMGCMPMQMPGIVCPPVYECPQERCIHREICHEVPHVCPVNTRIINHHIYKHTYSPCYTCCEENVVSNVNEGCCGRF